jgi:hypothetical protein
MIPETDINQPYASKSGSKLPNGSKEEEKEKKKKYRTFISNLVLHCIMFIAIKHVLDRTQAEVRVEICWEGGGGHIHVLTLLSVLCNFNRDFVKADK